MLFALNVKLDFIWILILITYVSSVIKPVRAALVLQIQIVSNVKLLM